MQLLNSGVFGTIVIIWLVITGKEQKVSQTLLACHLAASQKKPQFHTPQGNTSLFLAGGWEKGLDKRQDGCRGSQVEMWQER